MRSPSAVGAGLVGVAVVAAVAPLVPVTAGIALGASVTTLVTWRAATDRYDLAGATLLLGVGATVLLTARFPAEWARTPLVALWLFGTLSLSVVVLRYLLGFVGRRVVRLFVREGEEGAVWDALSALAGTLVIAWSVLTAQEKAVRVTGITLGGSATMVLDALGYDVPVAVPFVHEALTVTVSGFELSVPLWVLESGVDAAMVVFVGCVVVGFHTLGTLAATWRAVTNTGSRATDATSGGTPGDHAPATGQDGEGKR